MGGFNSGWHGGCGRPRRKQRVSECHAVVKVEQVYRSLPNPLRPGLELRADGYYPDGSGYVQFELTPHPIWKRGRLFFRCYRCGRRCTRLYVPRRWDGLACRVCHNLTYFTQQAHNYNKWSVALVRALLAGR